MQGTDLPVGEADALNAGVLTVNNDCGVMGVNDGISVWVDTGVNEGRKGSGEGVKDVSDEGVSDGSANPDEIVDVDETAVSFINACQVIAALVSTMPGTGEAGAMIEAGISQERIRTISVRIIHGRGAYIFFMLPQHFSSNNDEWRIFLSVQLRQNKFFLPKSRKPDHRSAWFWGCQV